MKAIMACDPYGGVGYENGLPWHSLEGDLARFKSLTQGSTVVMGRRTWLSLPIKPLPNRTNIVYSTVELELPEGVTVINDVNQLSTHDDSVWFIGGGALLEFAFPYITEFHLTRAKQAYTCDTFMNLLYLEQEFVKVSEQSYSDNVYEIWRRNETVSSST